MRPLIFIARRGLPALLLSCLITGCSIADVKAWQRGNLAKPSMVAQPDEHRAALELHSYESKEATSGGYSVGGGGCGCN